MHMFEGNLSWRFYNCIHNILNHYYKLFTLKETWHILSDHEESGYPMCYYDVGGVGTTPLPL